MHARDHTADELLTNSRQCRQIASNQCVTRTPGTETPAPHFSRKRSGRRPPTRFVVPRRHKLARCVRRERRTHDGKSQVIGCPEDRRGRFHHVAHAREIDCRIRFQRRVCIGIVRPKKQEYSLDKSKAVAYCLDMDATFTSAWASWKQAIHVAPAASPASLNPAVGVLKPSAVLCASQSQETSQCL